MTITKQDFWAPDEAPAAPGLRLFALVDCSGAPGLHAALREHRKLRWKNLFEGSREAGAKKVAPILIDLGPVTSPPDNHASSLLTWLMRTCQANSAWLSIRSSWALEPLAQALQRRLDILLPDHLPALLRYFDTRVFEALIGILNADQRTAFLGIADKWLWLDRAGALCQQRSQHHAADALTSLLQLSTGQEAAMIHAAEPDAVVHHIRQAAPDLCEGRSIDALHTIARECVPVAHAKGIEDIRQIGLFCLVELEQGPRFYERPGWAEGLARMAKTDKDFVRLVQEMEARP